jgi:hypothetical protein
MVALVCLISGLGSIARARCGVIRIHNLAGVTRPGLGEVVCDRLVVPVRARRVLLEASGRRASTSGGHSGWPMAQKT